jgi:4-amino-4-deoxy-L-arabinose transferase-like glycosyltransferase
MRLVLAALAALTLLRLILCATLPLSPDEIYYFMWSQHLQPGYFDHPPMIALCIRAGTLLFGPTALGIRFLTPIMAALGSLLLWHTGETLFPHRQAGLIAAALFNATLLAGAGSVMLVPDMPLLLFWTAGLAALAQLITTGNPRWWLAIGLAAGFALLSKYTGLLFIAAVFIWLIASPEGRATLRTPWPWAAVALAFLLFAPDLYWNAIHGWVSYFKQGGRVSGAPNSSITHAPQFLAELLLGQPLFFTPIIFGLVACGLWRLRLSHAPAAHLLIWLTVVPGVVLLEHVLSGRVEPNWTGILYPSACLAAAALPMATLRRWLKPALGLGFALTGLVYAQALTPILPIRASADPSALQLDGWQTFATQAAASNPAFITADDYATTVALAHYAPASVPVIGVIPPPNPDTDVDLRWAYFPYPTFSDQNLTGIILTRRKNIKAICPTQIGTLTRRRGTQIIDTYRVCLITAPTAVLLPRP